MAASSLSWGTNPTTDADFSAGAIILFQNVGHKKSRFSLVTA